MVSGQSEGLFTSSQYSASVCVMCVMLEVHMGNTKALLSKPKRCRYCTPKTKLGGQAENLFPSSQYIAIVCLMSVRLGVEM